MPTICPMPKSVSINVIIVLNIAIKKNKKKYILAGNVVYLDGYSLTNLARVYNPIKDKVFNPATKNSAPVDNHAKIV